MSDEIKAAAERLLNHTGLYCLPTDGGPDNGGGFVSSVGDTRRVAEAYLADLAAREAEQLERAKPIDEEWLEKQHYRRDNECWSCRYVDLRRLSDGRWSVFIVSGTGSSLHFGTLFQTRGDLLDLMAGLKIPTKEGAK